MVEFTDSRRNSPNIDDVTSLCQDISSAVIPAAMEFLLEDKQSVSKTFVKFRVWCLPHAFTLHELLTKVTNLEKSQGEIICRRRL